MAPNNAMFVDLGAKKPIVRKNKNQTNFRRKYQKIITPQKCKLFSHFSMSVFHGEYHALIYFFYDNWNSSFCARVVGTKVTLTIIIFMI